MYEAVIDDICELRAENAKLKEEVKKLEVAAGLTRTPACISGCFWGIDHKFHHHPYCKTFGSGDPVEFAGQRWVRESSANTARCLLRYYQSICGSMKQFECKCATPSPTCFECLNTHHIQESAKLVELIKWLVHSHDPGCDECAEHGGCSYMVEARKILTIVEKSVKE